MKGTYILSIIINQNKKIQVGKLGEIYFKKGCYFYVGSALNGLEKRIERHYDKNKKIHWHIDFLLNFGKIFNVYYKEGNKKIECEIAEKFNQNYSKITDFGCSDCKCESHLFYSLNNDISKFIKSLDMKKFG